MPKSSNSKALVLTGNLKKAVDKEISKKLRRNIELKGFDSMASSVLLGNTTYLMQNLTSIAQGTDINARIGNRIKVKNLYFHGQFSGALNSTSAGPYSNGVRLIIFQDMNEDGLAPSATDLLANPTNPVSHLNWENSVTNNRFRILVDKIFQLNKVDDSTGTPTSVVSFSNASYAMKSFYRKSIPSATSYSGSTNVAWGKGQLYLFVMNDSNTDRPTLNYAVRVKYEDM